MTDGDGAQMANTSQQTSEADRYAALGRLFHFIRERGLRDYLPRLDWWMTLGGEGWALDWQDGPFVDEIILKLVRASMYDDAGERDDSLYGQVKVEPGVSATLGELSIAGVPFSLRALDPIGYDATYERVWDGLHRSIRTQQ